MRDDWQILMLGGPVPSDLVLVLRNILMVSTGLQGLLSQLGLSMPNELMVSLGFRSCLWKPGPLFSSTTGFFCSQYWGALTTPQQAPELAPITTQLQAPEEMCYPLVSSHYTFLLPLKMLPPALPSRRNTFSS